MKAIAKTLPVSGDAIKRVSFTIGLAAAIKAMDARAEDFRSVGQPVRAAYCHDDADYLRSIAKDMSPEPPNIRCYDKGPDEYGDEHNPGRYTVIFTGLKMAGCNPHLSMTDPGHYIEPDTTVHRPEPIDMLSLAGERFLPPRPGQRHQHLGERVHFLTLPKWCRAMAMIEYDKLCFLKEMPQ